MINGETFLIGGKNLSLLLNKLNLKKIPFYNLKECQDKIFITIENKHVKNFIDLIGKTWYYKRVKKVGFSAILNKVVKNIGIFIGAIIFTVSAFTLDNLLLSVKIEADSSITPCIKEVLNKNDIKKYRWFNSINLNLLQEEIYAENPLICYSSVYKRGNTLVVKAEKSTFFSGGITKDKTQLLAECDGEILSLSVLRGYPLKKVGDKVKKGEIIVSGEKVEEEKVYKTFVLASVKMLCTYTYVSQERESFALAKAKILCGEQEYLFQEITKQDNTVTITLKYVITIGDLI